MTAARFQAAGRSLFFTVVLTLQALALVTPGKPERDAGAVGLPPTVRLAYGQKLSE